VTKPERAYASVEIKSEIAGAGVTVEKEQNLDSSWRRKKKTFF
jgi:hypothetical protein